MSNSENTIETYSPIETIKNNNVGLNQLKIDSLSIKKASLILRSINHKLRQGIIKLLEDNGKLTVTEIYVKMRLEQSVASQHLAILRKGGFVDTIRDGKNIYYTVNNTKINYLQHIVQLIINSTEN